MNPLLTTCPVCAGALTVTRLHCRSCDTSVEGHFETGRMGRLRADQLQFVETFIRCEGKLNRMERELGLSYPTLRSRLTEVITQMGFELGPEPAEISDKQRHRILDELASGEISSEQAMQQLQGS
ncbi:MAG TPA: DUF2089 domain-containing protein [Anaerolineales bacterium]|nr:DUF2089 domain-containing protein [Anaerolineales bacterium]